MSPEVTINAEMMLISGNAVPTAWSAAMPAIAEEPAGGLRYTVTVTKFENRSGWAGHWSIGDAWDTVLTDMLNQTGKFIVLGETDMRAAALDEQDFAASGLVDDATAAEIGKILGVQALIFGEVTTYSAEDKQGKEKVKKQVWTGEYETDKDGNVIEQEGLFGIKHKQKKLKNIYYAKICLC